MSNRTVCAHDGLTQEDYIITIYGHCGNYKITDLIPFLVKMSDHYILFCSVLFSYYSFSLILFFITYRKNLV